MKKGEYVRVVSGEWSDCYKAVYRISAANGIVDGHDEYKIILPKQGAVNISGKCLAPAAVEAKQRPRRPLPVCARTAGRQDVDAGASFGAGGVAGEARERPADRRTGRREDRAGGGAVQGTAGRAQRRARSDAEQRHCGL
eukprot:2143760-Prymnesium_polylepis.1